MDHVFPDVPVRQWVLSLPYRLRYRLAWDHDLCRAVVAVSMHPAPRLTALDVAEVLATVEPRITRLLERRGLGDRDDSASEADAWADEAPGLAGLAAASVQGTVALGHRRGARIGRLVRLCHFTGFPRESASDRN